MASLEVTKIFEGRSNHEIYDAGVAALKKAGFGIFKERPIAYLVMGKRDEAGKAIDCNVMVRMSFPPVVMITLGSELLSEAELKPWADKVLVEIENGLKV